MKKLAIWLGILCWSCSGPRADAAVHVKHYPWLADWSGALPLMVPLESRFPAPSGYTRVKAEGFGAWLRGLPIRMDRQTVLSHSGDALSRPAAAIVALDVGAKNRQQCADTAYRLHAEYLWHSGLARKARYHFTSGDVSTYAAWLGGERFKIKGRGITRLSGRRRGHTHETFRQWLDHLFIYAGTRSVARDSVSVASYGAAQGGDVFVQGGSPGHAVIILDIVTDAAGRRLALLGQGFMPAEDLHVLEAPWAVDDVWFPLEGAVQTPSWPSAFSLRDLRRFKTPDSTR
ncbi:MAG: DUF4846 domain-containing protein [Bradymonadia bacterium]